MIKLRGEKRVPRLPPRAHPLLQPPSIPPNTLPQITICTFTPAHKPALGRQSSNVRAAAAAACRCRVVCASSNEMQRHCLCCSVNKRTEVRNVCFFCQLPSRTILPISYLWCHKGLWSHPHQGICSDLWEFYFSFVSFHMWKLQQTFSYVDFCKQLQVFFSHY